MNSKVSFTKAFFLTALLVASGIGASFFHEFEKQDSSWQFAAHKISSVNIFTQQSQKIQTPHEKSQIDVPVFLIITFNLTEDRHISNQCSSYHLRGFISGDQARAPPVLFV